MTWLAALVLGLGAGCGAGVSTAGSGCPPRAQRNAPVQIDWVDFVQLGGRQYVHRIAPGAAPSVPADQLGRRLGVVRCRLLDTAPQAGYHPLDGDAAFLAPGTPVYAVLGRSDAVAAERDGRYQRYVLAPWAPGPAALSAG